MAQKTYSDKTTLSIDLQLWLAQKNGTALDLSMFPRLAANRWPWMLASWDTRFYPAFKEQANGDGYLEDALEVLENHVQANRNGALINPFRDAEVFANSTEFLATIDIPSIEITPAEQELIDQELRRVSEFTDEDFLAMKTFLKNQMDVAFDFIGLGDPLYDQYRGRSASPFQRTYFVEDLYQINDAIQMLNFVNGILMEFKYIRKAEPNLLAFANAQLAQGDSAVRTDDIYQSYFPVPFEQSLEQMARDYLGDAGKWYELVTINKLKPPYVDLHGVKVYLTENASGNIVRVSSNEKRKYQINAKVKIGSRTVPDEVRQVESLRDNQDGTFSVFLSGKQDLAKLRTEHQAYLRVYEPETINDFSFVLVPVAVAAPFASMPEPELAELKKLDKSLYAFGVDLAIDDVTGDLKISSSGDLAIQYGIPAVRQAVRNVLRTEFAELPLHPEYGLPSNVGLPMLGGDSAAKVATIIQNAVLRDGRFTSVAVSDILIAPDGTLSMSVNVTVAGATQLIPLAFVV